MIGAAYAAVDQPWKVDSADAVSGGSVSVIVVLILLAAYAANRNRADAAVGKLTDFWMLLFFFVVLPATLINGAQAVFGLVGALLTGSIILYAYIKIFIK